MVSFHVVYTVPFKLSFSFSFDPMTYRPCIARTYALNRRIEVLLSVYLFYSLLYDTEIRNLVIYHII